LSGQAEQLQQSVAFFHLGEEAAPARKAKPEPDNGKRRANGASVMRAVSSSTQGAPRAVSGNFRPY
jgi:hypothetical protein